MMRWNNQGEPGEYRSPYTRTRDFVPMAFIAAFLILFFVTALVVGR